MVQSSADTTEGRFASSSYSTPADTVKNTEPEVQSIEGGDTDLDLKTLLDDAEILKQEGTEHFKAGSWAQALASYRSALGRLPKRVEKSKAPVRPPNDDEEDDDDKENKPEEGEEPLTGLELEVVKLRSVLNANVGACHFKLGEHKDAVKACTDALSDDPKYVKALQRRASCNEQINTWTSLGQVHEDYMTLLQILPSDSPLRSSTSRALVSLKPRLEAAQKKETGEMMGKLKELGNSFLGNFGLSTDNFKFEPNGQGGYSVNFGQ